MQILWVHKLKLINRWQKIMFDPIVLNIFHRFVNKSKTFPADIVVIYFQSDQTVQNKIILNF